MTLLLSRRDVAGLMTTRDYLDAVELGFRAGLEGAAESPHPMAVAGQGGTFHAKGASLALGRRYVALKLNGNFPANPPALPTVQGAILLCDGANGALLAVIDSIEVTLRRTAAATALAARHLARPDSATLLLCGCGAQALPQVEALAGLFPLRRCLAWDVDFARAQAFALRAAQLGFPVEAVRAFEPVARESDVVVTCTTARMPFLEPAHVARGAFVAAVGADSPEKSEIHPELMAGARVVVDAMEQCLEMGDLRHAVRAGTMGAADVHSSLGEIVGGLAPGRVDDETIFVFDSTGTALQDVAAAAALYERACRQRGFAEFDFSAAT